MSGTLPAHEPECLETESDSVELLLQARPRDLGGFAVRRVLPAASRRQVGPFIFFDHFGPAQLPAGTGMDVRPHPHIGLATVTYLFEGEIIHRDSLGNVHPIRPGDINWMIAGRGIVHSERSSDEERRRGPRLHGIQSWVALPLEQEETDPAFQHHPLQTIPRVERPGAGSTCSPEPPTAPARRWRCCRRRSTCTPGWKRARGCRSTTSTPSGPLRGRGRRRLRWPELRRRDDGGLAAGHARHHRGRRPTRFMMVGGARLAGERLVWWNFVSSSRERLERAKEDWNQDRFPSIPTDAHERIPLPDR